MVQEEEQQGHLQSGTQFLMAGVEENAWTRRLECVLTIYTRSQECTVLPWQHPHILDLAAQSINS